MRTRALAWAWGALLGGCGGGALTPPSGPVPQPGASPPAGAVMVPNEGWDHVSEGSPVSYQANPPASGPHYPVWVRYQEHATVVARPYWVHNLEHGGIVLLYRPDAAPSVVAALRDAYRAIPADPACGHRRALLAADPLLPGAVAAVAADWVLVSDGVDRDAVLAFVAVRRGQGREAVCADGTRP